MTNPTMMTYIQQEQAAMLRLLAAYPEAQDAALAGLTLTGDDWLMLGIGSSYNAALSAQIYMERQAGVRITLAQPYPFQHYAPQDPHTALVIAISQSGQSTATIDALARFKATATPSIAVTSAPGKELSQATTTTLDIGIGHEQVGYVTLGFTATVLSLMLLGLRAGVKRGRVTAATEQAELAEFTALAERIDATIAATQAFWAAHAADLGAAPQLTGIAYGPSVGSVKELETKFTETVRIPCDGQELEAFMHGPYLSINATRRLLFIQTPAAPAVAAKAAALRAYEQSYTDHVFTLNYTSPVTEPQTLNLGVVADEAKVPFLGGVPLQVLAWLATQARGIDLAHQIFTDFSERVHNKTEKQDYV